MDCIYQKWSMENATLEPVTGSQTFKTYVCLTCLHHVDRRVCYLWKEMVPGCTMSRKQAPATIWCFGRCSVGKPWVLPFISMLQYFDKYQHLNSADQITLNPSWKHYSIKAVASFSTTILPATLQNIHREKRHLLSSIVTWNEKDLLIYRFFHF